MRPKIVLVTIGALMTLHGIGLYFIAGSMTGYTDPTEAMIAMGARLNETIGVMTLLIGVISLASFNIDSEVIIFLPSVIPCKHWEKTFSGHPLHFLIKF